MHAVATGFGGVGFDNAGLAAILRAVAILHHGCLGNLLLAKRQVGRPRIRDVVKRNGIVGTVDDEVHQEPDLQSARLDRLLV